MQAVLVFHNILRWAVLLFAVWSLFNAITGVLNKRSFTATDNRSNLLCMIFFDIQLLLGLILYFNGPFALFKEKGGAVMKDSALRFLAVEHISMMIIAWLLVHVGRSMVKRADTDAKKHKKMLLFTGIALLVVLASIPWPFREAIARPLFRWFN